MLLENRTPQGYWRTLLVLGRASNVPTVWSNCLAGWLLGGGGNWGHLGFLFLGATLLYIGGMFLNDACDAEFDRQHRRERPIPSGAISLNEVWAWGTGWLALGLLCLAFAGKTTFVLGVLLVIAILVYDVIHKAVSFSPVFMALCRVLLYLVAASTSAAGVTGLALWSALVLGGYIIGLSYLAKRESTGFTVRVWPLTLLAAPLLLAALINGPGHRLTALVTGALFALWCWRSLSYVYRPTNRNIGLSVNGLLAGIVLVDLVAVGGEFFPVFIVLFAAARVFQRFIPAT